MRRADVLELRLRAQRLSGPAALDPVAAVKGLLCVQAQDMVAAAAMVARRAGTTAGSVWGAVESGELIRTHVLRPTWHLVAASDLRWLLELTSRRVESSLGSRHRQLGLGPQVIETGLLVLSERLRDRQFAGRTELAAALESTSALDSGDSLFSQQVGHLLLIAELRGLVCSAPTSGPEHLYALVDEVVPAGSPRDRRDAVRELVERFVSGHGPTTLKDIQRWTPLPLGELRPAVAELGLESMLVEGDELWWRPAGDQPESRPERAWLLSTFDEAFLSHRIPSFETSAGNPGANAARRFGESGGGPVICDLVDVGQWRRPVRTGVVSMELDPALTADQREEIDQARLRFDHLLEGTPSASR